MGARSSERPNGSPPEPGYLLEGRVLEVPPEARYRATGANGPDLSVAAWRIRRGHINAVDVSRQIVLVVWTRAARLILLDERTTPEQVLALLDAFGGKLGGPLAERALQVAEDIGFSQVPITYRLDGSRGTVSIPQRFRLAFLVDPGGGAHASQIWINVPEHDLVRTGSGVAAAYREFRFVQGQRTGAPATEEEAG
jgi:hypothetical protein